VQTQTTFGSREKPANERMENYYAIRNLGKILLT